MPEGDNATTQPGGGGQQEPQQQQEPEGSQQQERTFTQQEVDRIIGERVGRERSRIPGGDLDALIAKAKAHEEAENAKKPELERLGTQVQQQQAKNAELEKALQSARVENSILAVAKDKKLVDPAAVQALLDASRIEFGDDGKPSNVGDLIDELVKAKPYLAGEAGGEAGGTGGGFDGGARSGGGGSPTMSELMRRAAGYA